MNQDSGDSQHERDRGRPHAGSGINVLTIAALAGLVAYLIASTLTDSPKAAIAYWGVFAVVMTIGTTLVLSFALRSERRQKWASRDADWRDQANVKRVVEQTMKELQGTHAETDFPAEGRLELWTEPRHSEEADDDAPADLPRDSRTDDAD
jgi:hypothetical protein